MTRDVIVPTRPPLVAGSPIARALYHLMAGDQLVRLSGERSGEQALEQVLDLLHYLWPFEPQVDVVVLSPNDQLADRAATYAEDYLNLSWKGWGVTVEGPSHRGLAGQFLSAAMSTRLLRFTGPLTVSAERMPALVVTGIHEESCVGIGHDCVLEREAKVTYNWFEHHQPQVLIAGPNRAWHHHVPLLLGAEPGGPLTRFQQPWGPVPTEVLLAGLD